MNHKIISPRPAVRQITEILLEPEIDYAKLANATKELQTIFTSLSEIDFDSPEMTETIFLDSGAAIAPKWAGMCIDDMVRTKRYISGIYKAIKTVQAKKQKSTVTVFYTGTGPFATLLMPLTTIFSPEELQLVLLEVNPLSIAGLQKVITKMEAEAYIQSIHQADAVNFVIPEDIQADILVVECLQHALAREPQVAICYNLLPQLSSKTILIPEDISLHIAAMDFSGMNQDLLTNLNSNVWNYIELSEPVFSLNKETILKQIATYKETGFQFPEISTSFTKEQLKEKSVLAILTDILVFDKERIRFRDSGLTIQANITDSNVAGVAKTVSARYILGEDPYLDAYIK